MRLLLDECVPRPFRKVLPGHEVYTVEVLGLKGLDNGALVAGVRTKQIDVLLTLDQNLPYQQNMQQAGIAVLVMVVRSNRLEDVEPLAPLVLEALRTIQAGQCLRVGPV